MTTANDIKKVNKNLKKVLFDITNKKQMKKLGNLTIGLVHDRVRNKGKGIARPEGNRRTLKKVTEKYALWRAKQDNKHSQAATGRKSNLTFTGDMLDDMQLVELDKNHFKIGYGNDENQDKSDHQHAQGRQFLYLGKSELKLLKDAYDKTVGKIVKKS